MIDKTISAEEFHRDGYLQEANRLFFHPLGLSLAVSVHEGKMYIGPILDDRDNPEGFTFDHIDEEFVTKALLVDNLAKRRNKIRKEKLGYVIQPLEKR